MSAQHATGGSPSGHAFQAHGRWPSAGKLGPPARLQHKIRNCSSASPPLWALWLPRQAHPARRPLQSAALPPLWQLRRRSREGRLRRKAGGAPLQSLRRWPLVAAACCRVCNGRQLGDVRVNAAGLAKASGEGATPLSASSKVCAGVLSYASQQVIEDRFTLAATMCSCCTCYCHLIKASQSQKHLQGVRHGYSLLPPPLPWPLPPRLLFPGDPSWEPSPINSLTADNSNGEHAAVGPTFGLDHHSG